MYNGTNWVTDYAGKSYDCYNNGNLNCVKTYFDGLPCWSNTTDALLLNARTTTQLAYHKWAFWDDSANAFNFSCDTELEWYSFPKYQYLCTEAGALNNENFDMVWVAGYIEDVLGVIQYKKRSRDSYSWHFGVCGVSP
ncbi:MAG: hypothetical protein JW940_21405 [Polyangiaceae bacterium]|nr:hypothetical protein [Polyangiaceae bacterium]